MAAPNTHVRVSSAWKQVNKIWVRVSGTWKQVNNAHIRVSGAWKKFHAAVTLTASSFSGTFSAFGVTATRTSAARTYTLGAGNSGKVKFDNTYYSGSSLRYSINGGSYIGNDIYNGLVITLTNGQTLTIQSAAMPVNSDSYFDVIDFDTNTVLENATLSRGSP